MTFRSCALQIHSMPAQPMLHIALSAGLSSLKLPACFANGAGEDGSARLGGVGPPAHLGGRAFGDDRNNLLDVSGATTSVTAAPTFPPAAGLTASSPPSASGRGAASSLFSQPTGGPIPSTMLTPQNPWSIHQMSHDSSLSLNSPHNGGDSNSNSNSNSNNQGNSSRDNNGNSKGHPKGSKHESKNNDCPVCDGAGLGQLAREVPWSHHINSTLVCRITGKIMNENDPPMVLPNGRVYSRTVRVCVCVCVQLHEGLVSGSPVSSQYRRLNHSPLRTQTHLYSAPEQATNIPLTVFRRSTSASVPFL